VRAAAAAVAAVVVLAGCGSSGGRHPSPTPREGTPAERTPEPPSDEQLIEQMLQDRAEALEAGDRRAYLMTSTRARRRVELRAFNAAAALPLRDVDLDPASIDAGDVRAAVRVVQRYRIGHVGGTFQDTGKLQLVKAGGRWRVEHASATRGLPPWEVGRFRVHRTLHFVVLAPRGAAAGDLLAALEDGYAAMRSRLRLGRLRQRYLVVAAADPDQARALTKQIRGLDALAAISDSTIRQRRPAQSVVAVLSLRLLVVYSTFARLDAVSRQRTITHELTHALLAGKTSGRAPSWLVEGVAMYVSGDRRPAPPGADLAALSGRNAIARLSGPAQARAYATASAAAYAIADRFGARRLLAFYDMFNREYVKGTAGPKLTNRALRRALGVGLDDLI
jgi:hypothetical protein